MSSTDGTIVERPSLEKGQTNYTAIAIIMQEGLSEISSCSLTAGMLVYVYAEHDGIFYVRRGSTGCISLPSRPNQQDPLQDYERYMLANSEGNDMSQLGGHTLFGGAYRIILSDSSIVERE